jgi:oligosaccharide reducing-end xylanase
VNAKPSTPTIVAGGATTFCAGGSVILTSSSTTGNQWYKDGAAISSATSATYTATISGSYTVIVTSAEGCSSTVSEATTVTANPLPAAPVVSNTAYCIGSTTTSLTATALSGHILSWYGTNATGGTASSTPPTPSSAAAGSTDYYVSQVSAEDVRVQDLK